MKHLSHPWTAYFFIAGTGAALLVPSTAFAFKTGTHAASANEVMDQLEERLSEDGGTLVFEANGRRLNLNVSQADAYMAVLNWPDFFRAGVIGPDGFPDPLTGQILMHGDQSVLVKDLVETMTGSRPPDHHHDVPFEQRHGPAEYRSIDFATAMLAFLQTYPADAQEYQQIVAFIMGYLSHGIGDSFAHTWVNELAGGAWSLSDGSGLWGTFSEEIKHVAVETMVDKLVPNHLKSVPGDGGGYEGITLRAPVAFLDAFYSRQSFGSTVPSFPTGGSIEQFLGHYRNFNTYNGGFFYNYYNAETQVAGTLKSWSGMGGFFDFAEDVHKNKYVNFGLDVAELPEKALSWLGANPLGWVDELTFGFVDCHADNWGAPTPIGDLREAISFVGGVNDRIDVYNEKVRIIRRNWIKLAQCTSENMARSGAKDFDPSKPEINRDSCADVVRAGWTDQPGGENGLYRGSIRPRPNVDRIAYVDLNNDERFLLDLKAAFLGEDANDLFLLVRDPINNHAVWDREEANEYENGHRKLTSNLVRMLDYAVDFGFRLDELDQAIIPDDGGKIKETFDGICDAARDPAFERCLDIAFAPIAAAGRTIVCAADHLQCTTQSVKKCLGHACTSSCGGILSNSDCAEICGTGGVSGCKSTCDDWFCLPEVCVPLIGCGRICEPVTHTVCNFSCDIFSSEDRNNTCLAAAVEEAECGLEHVVCEFNNLKDTILLENYAEELLTPVRVGCDAVDEALRLFKCLKGDPNKSEAEQRSDRKTCVVDLCEKQTDYTLAQCNGLYTLVEDTYEKADRVKDALGRVADALKDRPAHEVVNLAFLLEDLKRSPEYLASLRRTVESTRDAWLGSKPPASASDEEKADYAERGRVITRWENLIRDVTTLGSSADPLADFERAADEAADLIEDSKRLGMIPTIIGPTAQDIYREIGPSFTKTFTPFFNAVQGMKLAPLATEDMVDVIASESDADGYSRLPTNQSHPKTSAACRGGAANPYCDVLISFDDPNCIDCPDASHVPDPSRYDWVPGRSIVAFNEYDPADPERNVTTSFPFANSQESYESLYTRIFRVPSAVPGFAGFDDPDSMWTSSGGAVSIDPNASEGSGSMAVSGCTWSRLDSPRFNTTDWGVIGDILKLDLFIPADQQNTYWTGDLMFFVTIPGASIYNQPLPGWVGLTGLPRGRWIEVSFTVPRNVQDALLADHANALFSMQLNYSDCDSPILIDNLRFDGNLRDRTTFHIRGSELHGVTTNSLFSFDSPSDWSTYIPVSGSDNRVEGTGALAVRAGGYLPIKSRKFRTGEMVGVTSRLSIDVFLPKPQPNIYWNGDVSLSLTCGPFINQWIGQQSLTNRFEDEYNTLEFVVPDYLVRVLRGELGSYSNCEIQVNLNTNPAGTILLDNMGFH